MNSSAISETEISYELRSNVIEIFRSLNAELETHVTPEILEKDCFDKSNNNQEYYLNLCNDLVTHYTVQLQNKQNSSPCVNIPGNQFSVELNPVSRPNLINNNNGVSPDPIDALQTLSVTAGQPNQMNIQQNNYQVDWKRLKDSEKIMFGKENKGILKRIDGNRIRGIPNYNYRPGSLSFQQGEFEKPESNEEVTVSRFPFSGIGRRLGDAE